MNRSETDKKTISFCDLILFCNKFLLLHTGDSMAQFAIKKIILFYFFIANEFNYNNGRHDDALRDGI